MTKCIQMRLKVVLLVFIASLNSGLVAQDGYPVASISPDLVAGANALVRNKTEKLQIISEKEASYEVTEVFTVFNASGKEAAAFHAYYDKFHSVDFNQGFIFDAQGERIQKINKSMLTVTSAVSNINLFDDYKIVYYIPEPSTYPFTVEYRYTINYKSTFHLPTWTPQTDESIPVEHSAFRLEFAEGQKPRILASGHQEKVQILEESASVHAWEIDQMEAFEAEPFAPSTSNQLPAIHFAPNNFEVEGYRGSMKTWKDFGLWVEQLNAGQQELPEKTREEIAMLCADLTDPRDKIAAIYHYLQNSTRYVSIQLGIGGWRPFSAKYVEEKGYGDCKALSNYMVAMLEASGIEARYVLIQASKQRDDFKEDFPSFQFNHAIVCVPMEKDTVWLECTSPSNPAAYLGSSTAGRPALVLTGSGGQLVKTPNLGSQDNISTSRFSADLTLVGSIKGNAEMVFSGADFEEYLHLKTANKTERAVWTKSNTSGTGCKTGDLALTMPDSRIAEGKVSFDLEQEKYARITGSRSFLPMMPLNKWDYIPPAVEERSQPVLIRKGWTRRDTAVFTLPAGTSVEAIPEGEGAAFDLGNYHSECKQIGKMLVFTREFELKQGTYAASEYKNLIELFKTARKGDGAIAVLKME